MKVALRKSYGLPDQIKVVEVPAPVPGEGDVLIRVRATTVNRTDCANLTARPFIMRFVLGLIRPGKMILGTDFAGEVVKTGEQVQSFRAGDRVFGFKDTGLESQAEFVVVPADELYGIPDNISFQQAAASLEGAHYAYSFIHKVSIQSGQRILINGASGAIGSALLQLLRPYDVNITATCSTKNRKLIKSLGADEVIDYTTEAFTDRSTTYDFIFDTVGKSTFIRCKSLLNPTGVYISSELGPFAQNVFFSIVAPFFKKKVIFPIPFNRKETIPFIIGQLKSGNFVPVIDREYPIDAIADAYRYVLTGQKTGNVIISM